MKIQFKTEYLKPLLDVLITEVEDLVALSIEEGDADDQDARTKEESWFLFNDEW